MKFTGAMKLHADLAFSKLSNKAQWFYFCTEPLRLYKANGLFYVRGAITLDELTFEELNKTFEELYDLKDVEM